MAIQVNGTTVIDNSRALTNISSVDSSVVSAMSSAGVGGATSLITDWTNVPNAISWSLSLGSSYDIIRIYFDRVGVNNQATSVQFWARFQYSGGTETGFDYDYKDLSGNQTKDAWEKFGMVNGSGSATPTTATGWIEIANHAPSDKLTQYRAAMTASYNISTNHDNTQVTSNGILHAPTVRSHTSILFYTDYSANVYYNTGKYRVIGVNV